MTLIHKPLKYRLIFPILALISWLAPFSESFAERSPYISKVRGDLTSLLSGEGKVATLHVKTIDGNYRIRLTPKLKQSVAVTYLTNNKAIKREVFEPQLFAGDILLKTGQLSRFKYLRVAADVSKDKIRLIFYGPRKGRAYTVTAKLSKRAETSLNASVRLYNRFKTLKCGLPHAGSSALVSSLSTNTLTQAPKALPIFSPLKEVTFVLHANSSYYGIYGSETTAQLQAIMNAVEEIYTNQIGVAITINQIFIETDAGSDPFTGTDPETLLEDFSAYGNSAGYPTMADASHLFIGQDVDGETVGLAYYTLSDTLSGPPGPMCVAQGEFTYGFSQDYNPSLNSIITTHEIGHNFNASHTTGIMATSTASVTNTFSDTSISEINYQINNYGTCLNDLGPSISVKRSSFSSPKFKTGMTAGGLLPEDPCTTSLYCADKRSKLSDPTSTGTLIISTTTTGAETLNYRANINVSGHDENKVFLAASISCSNGSNISSIRKVIVPINPRTFCRKLASKIN